MYIITVVLMPMVLQRTIFRDCWWETSEGQMSSNQPCQSTERI